MKPFRYGDGDQSRIRKLLPLTPPTTRIWSSLPLRLPAIIPSSTVQTQTPERALLMLERFANMFLVYEREFRLPFHTYRDLEATLNRARRLASQTQLGDKRRDDVDKLAELARDAKAHFDARRRRRFQRTKWARDWYLEKLLFVWESCGGATRTSAKGKGDEARGGRLEQFLQLASEPVF